MNINYESKTKQKASADRKTTHLLILESNSRDPEEMKVLDESFRILREYDHPTNIRFLFGMEADL